MNTKIDKELIEMPDFDQWGLNVWSGIKSYEDISMAIKQGFEQGRSLGQREGRNLADKEWYLSQDASLQEWTQISDEQLQQEFETASLQDYAEWESQEISKSAVKPWKNNEG